MTPEEYTKRRERFIELARPLMKFLADEFHPHHVVVLNSETAEVSEGTIAYVSEDFIKSRTDPRPRERIADTFFR